MSKKGTHEPSTPVVGTSTAVVGDTAIVLLDGATGSELQRRGITMDPVLWSATATLSHPDILKAVHQDYIQAGSGVITANTFNCSKHNVLHAGRGYDFQRLNANAVSIARQASDESSLRPRPRVAASLSTIPPLDRVSYVDTGATTTRNFREQIQILEDEGADLLLLEMLLETSSAQSLLEACSYSHLPVWAGLCASKLASEGQLIGFRCPGGYESMPDEPFADLCAAVAGFSPSAMGVMHTRTELLDDALDIVARSGGPCTFVYPNAGHFDNPDWVFPDDSEMDYLCETMKTLAAKHSLRTVGGCCGTTPEFIRRLNATFRANTSPVLFSDDHAIR